LPKTCSLPATGGGDLAGDVEALPSFLPIGPTPGHGQNKRHFLRDRLPKALTASPEERPKLLKYGQKLGAKISRNTVIKIPKESGLDPGLRRGLYDSHLWNAFATQQGCYQFVTNRMVRRKPLSP
jgi:hypothetical protein